MSRDVRSSDVKDLDAASSASATDLVPAERNGRDVYLTAQQIADLGGGGGAVSSVDGRTGAVTLSDLYDANGAAATAQANAIAASQPLDSDLTAIAALTTQTFGRARLTDTNAAAAKTALALVSSDVGLGNVDNTSDATKNAASVTLTNHALSDTTTTVVNASDATKVAKVDLSGATSGKTATVAIPVTNNRTITLPDATDTLVGKATTDTLTNKSIDAAQLTGSVALARLPTGTASSNVVVGGVITGAGPTGDASHTLALTYNAAGQLTAVTNNAIAIAESAVTNLVSDLALKAPLASPALTGAPTAPTPTATDNSTTLATTAFLRTARLPYVFAQASVQLAVPSGVWTPVGLDTNQADTDSIHVLNSSSTTITSGSNTIALPTGTINIASAVGFPTSGFILINGPPGASTTTIVKYTGGNGASSGGLFTSGTTLTGCTLGTGTMATGQVVTPANESCVPPTLGLYIAAAQVSWAANATGQRGVRLVDNGLPVGSQQTASTNVANQNVAVGGQPLFNSGGSSIHIEVRQESGGVLNALKDGIQAPTLGLAFIGGV